MKIATWNINSIRKRVGNLADWLKRANPDVVVLQEIKCQEPQFPRLEIESAGYKCEVIGQKTFNGVALLSRVPPIEVTARALPGDDTDEQSRYVEAKFATSAGPLRVAGIYLPNGNPANTEKFPYKLGFMRRLRERAALLLGEEELLVMGGDYNVCPTDRDVYDPAGWADDALCRPESRSAFRAMLNLGMTDAYRTLGLSSRRLEQGQRPAHRPLASLAAGYRSAARLRYRQGRAWPRRTVGPCAGVV